MVFAIALYEFELNLKSNVPLNFTPDFRSVKQKIKASVENCYHERKVDDQYVFICQHGEEECIGNLIECADKFGMPVVRILACVNSITGNILEHQMAEKTRSLKPRLGYVPWVTFNGIHTEKINDEAQKDLLTLVCDTYTVFDQCKAREWTPQPDAAPVGFELYYESLCGFCQLFITRQFYPTFQKIGGIMNISLIPYGNAKERKVDDHYVFTCQHGEEECIGNLIETCTIYIVGDIQKYFPFINCLENFDDSDTPSKLLKPCADKFGMPLDRILACVNSTTGNILENQMAKKTDSLKPRHKYVPWVTLNGVHTEKINDEALSDLLKLICDTYTGPKPAACQQMTSRCST